MTKRSSLYEVNGRSWIKNTILPDTPRFKDSAQGNGRLFLHGEISESIGEICLTDSIRAAKEITTQEEYVVLDAEEIEEILREQRKGGK